MEFVKRRPANSEETESFHGEFKSFPFPFFSSYFLCKILSLYVLLLCVCISSEENQLATELLLLCVPESINSFSSVAFTPSKS